MHTPPPGSASPPTDPSKPPIWRVGTLTYTTGGLVVLFAWLLWGDFAWSLKDRSVPPVVQLLLKSFNTSDVIMGILIGSLPAAVGLFLAPVISYKSDRHRGKWGRRVPFILLTTPITSFSMFGLAASPWLGMRLHEVLGPSSPGTTTSFLIVFGICWTLFEFATVAANALFGALVNDVVPQPVIGRFFGLFRALSLIAGMVFNFYIIGHAGEYYAWIFIGMGLLYGVGVTLMCLKVKEGEYPAPPPAEAVHGRRGGFLAAVKTYFHECFGHSYYLWYFAAVTLATIAMSPVNLFSVPYAASIAMDMGEYGKWVTWAYFCSLILAYPLGALADRIHPLRLTMIAMVLYTAAAIWSGIYARNAENFGIALFCHTVISGIFFTASASLPQRLLPRSRFAELVSAGGIVLSICNVAFPFALGAFLDHAHHDYSYTFFIGAALSVTSFVFLLVLHGKFMARGGPKGYVAPEDEDQPAEFLKSE